MASIDRIKGIVDIGRSRADRAEAKQARLKGQEAVKAASDALADGDVRAAVASLASVNPEIAQNLVTQINQIDPELGAQFKQQTAEGAQEGQLESQTRFGSNPRQLLDAELDAENAARANATDFESLSPVAQKQFTTVEKDFNKFTEDFRKSQATLNSLIPSVDEAVKNEISASQLGARVARVFENNRLTDEDVLRYTRRNSIPSGIEDMMLKLIQGTIPQGKADEIKEALAQFQGVLNEQVSRSAFESAQKLNNRVNTGLPTEQITKMFLPTFEAGVLDPKENQITPEKFLTLNPDSQRTMLRGLSDEELESFITELESFQSQGAQ